MATCEVCGNDYDKAFEVKRGGKSHTFDSFECAIHMLAPSCDHGSCKVIGHGIEADAASSAAPIARPRTVSKVLRIGSASARE